MTLGELLTELRENILHDRSDRVAGNSDVLWSDATLVRYIDEAQRRLAREALVLRDGTAGDATVITTVAGQANYVLHDSVLGVLSARVAGDTADLARAGHDQLDAYRQPDTLFFDPSSLSSLAPGKPLAFVTDDFVALDQNGGQLSAQNLRLYPTPSATYAGLAIQLRVVRMPLNRLRATSLKQEPEVPEDFHIEMLDWAAYLALRIVDRDAGDAGRAREFRASFEEVIKKAKSATMRKLFAPQGWGFGRNGYTWER